MATGINTDKINGIKIDLLTALEKLNGLKDRLDSCADIIQGAIEGSGKSEMTSKLNSIVAGLSITGGNVMNFIDVLSDVVSAYEIQDAELASTVIKDIGKLS